MISNKAGIYFDFNPPIITNSCINTIYDGDIDSLDCNPLNLIVEELENQRNINVYPNPTNDRITISTNETDKEMIQISITDLSGKVVFKSMKDSGKDLELNLESLETGTYLLIIRSVSGQLVKSSRIVKI